MFNIARGLVSEVEVVAFVHFAGMQASFSECRSANWCGVISERSRAKGSSSTASIPVAASRRSFSGSGRQQLQSGSGRRMRAGCGSKVTATDFASGARARARFRRAHARCARCTPSKLPTLTSAGPKSAGTSSSLWKTCIEKAVAGCDDLRSANADLAIISESAISDSRSQTPISFRHTPAAHPAASAALVASCGRS